MTNLLATNAQVSEPLGIFVSNDEVYIADTGNNRIRKILENGNIVTIAGNGKYGFDDDDGCIATKVQLARPKGVFVSSNGEVYIADTGNNRIRKVLENGNIITIAGNGEQGFSGDKGLATNAELDHPKGVFVSSNGEVYIADTGNHRIRKVLENGRIITIAGTEKAEYSGDDLAIYIELYNPTCVFVSSNNEIFIADREHHEIRKILKNGYMITIAGNEDISEDIEDYGDNGLATDVQLNFPSALFVSSNNEVYIADHHRIRKILENGNIITIAGNGEDGYNGDSPFDISTYPHIGSKGKSKFRIKLKKYERDSLLNTSICGYIPLLEILSPLFCKYILKNEQLITVMNPKQQKIIQKLIDSLIYNEKSELNFNHHEFLDLLFILGLFKNNEFFQLKKLYTSLFIRSLTIQNLSLKWEEIESYLAQCANQLSLENYILQYLNNFCIEFAAILIKTPGGAKSLPSLPIIVKNAAAILSNQALYEPNLIILKEQVEIESRNIESLYKDQETSDLKIQIGHEKYLYCHKTILSSSSTLFSAMLNSGSTFRDLNNDIIIADSSDDLELLEIIVKSCYGIQITNLQPVQIIPLLDMAMKHEMEYLIEYCNSSISINNYFDIIASCQDNLESFDSFYEAFVKFGIKHRRQLFSDYGNISKLPTKLWQDMFFKFSQEF